MKPTIKSSIPLTFFRFSTAIVLFLIADTIFSNYLVTYRDSHPYGLTRVKISSDGQVTYLSTYVGAFSEFAFWEFNERFQKSQLQRPINVMTSDNSWTVSVEPANAKEIERYSRTVRPINSPDIAKPIFWWNGPSGQVDWYDSVSRMRMASLGPVGPAVEAPARPEERFDVLSLNFFKNRYLPTLQGVYKLTTEPTEFSSKLVYKGSYETFGIGSEKYGSTRPSSLRMLIVHGNTLSVLDAAGSLLRDIKLPETAVSLFKERSEITLFNNGRVAIDGHRKRRNEKTILLLEKDGSLVRRVDYDTREIVKAMNGGVDPSDLLLLTPLMPPIPIPGAMPKSSLFQSIALSLILAAVVLWRQTWLGRRGAVRVAWVLFVLVSGLLGFLTYLVAYWDRRSEPCPECHRPRLVAEEISPHCGSYWTAPKPLGIEIIDSASGLTKRQVEDSSYI